MTSLFVSRQVPTRGLLHWVSTGGSTWIRVLALPFLFTACGSWPAAPVGSSIDATFRLTRIEKAARTSDATTTSPGVRAYQKWLSQTLSSHCRYYPSDSRYHMTLAKTCGPIPATFKSMARFLLEYDAPKLGRTIIVRDDKVFYQDLPNDCSWL